MAGSAHSMQAEKWLGLGTLEEALAADPPRDPALDQPRPPGLGLGADPRKYGKAGTVAVFLHLTHRHAGARDSLSSCLACRRCM
jgi:hypothetical protein